MAQVGGRPPPRGVLMVAAPYPLPGRPAAAAGMRAQGLARGLHARGHPVTVVCAGDAGAQPWDDAGVAVVPARYVDVEALARRAGLELRELRTGGGADGHGRTGLAREIAVRLCVPDRYVVWVPAAIAAARRHAARHELVITTGPVSAHLVGRAVVGARPWLVDCNDLWALNPDRSNGRVRDAIDHVMEERVLRRATRLTTVNEPMAEELRRRHGKPVAVVYSGFDPADFPTPGEPTRGGRRRVLFAGTLYPKQDLTPLLRALANGRRDGWLDPATLSVDFVGRLSDRAALEARRAGVGDFVRTSEPVSRPELLERLRSADALLLPSLRATDRNALPMKLFEYIGAGRPIIVFGPPDHLAAEVVAEHGLGVVLPDAAALERCLRRVVGEDGALPVASPRERARFSRDRTLASLGDVVDAL